MLLPVAILAAMGAATLVAYARVRATRDEVMHARAVIEASERVLSDLTDAETGQRGYLLAGRESYLAPYQRALFALRADTLDLRTLLAADSAQHAHLRELFPVIDDKMAELGRTVALRRAGNA
ncbi:MAG TPA: CHASE3 domain-containing protein, partial [Longimicrobiales bacterium]